MESVIISLIILTSYTIAVCVRWGVPHSLSRTFFSIERKWIFSAVVATSAGLLMSPLMEILPEAFQWLGFLTCAGCLFVSFAPNLDDELEETAHMAGAITLGLASQGIVLVLHPWLMFLWVLWIPFVSGKSRVFCAEMVGGLTLFSAILFSAI